MKFIPSIKISNKYFKHKKRFRYQIFGVYFILFCLLFFSSLFTGTLYTSLKKIFTTKDNKYLTVTPKSTDIGPLKFDTPSFFGKGHFTDKDVAQIEKISGVTYADPIYTLNAPSHIYSNILDMNYGTDLSIFAEARPFKNHRYSKNIKNISAIISSKILDIYNLSFAQANNLPKLSKKIIIGRNFNAVIGENSFKKNNESYEFKAKIIDLNSDVEIFGITLHPIVLKKLAKKIGCDIKIAKIKIGAKSGSDIVMISNTLTKLGYQVERNNNKLFEAVNKYLNKISYIAHIPLLFIFFIIVLFIQNQLGYMLTILKKEMGIQMTFGIFYRDLIFIWIFQYFKIVSYAMIAGFSSSYLLTKLIYITSANEYIKTFITLNFNLSELSIYVFFVFLFTITYLYIVMSKYFKKNTIVKLITL